MKITLKTYLLVSAFFNVTAFAQSVLFQDNFSSNLNQSVWISKAPTQWVDSGWLNLQDQDGWPRDSMAVVHDGDTNWSNYSISLVVQTLADGLADHANVLLRTDNFVRTSAVSQGSAYQLEFFGTRDVGGTSQKIQLSKTVNGSTTTLTDTVYGVSNNALNVVATLNGGNIEVSVNTQSLFTYIDSTPLLYGGIGVHTTWETHARFDDVTVQSIPEPGTYFLLAMGFFGILLRQKLIQTLFHCTHFFRCHPKTPLPLSPMPFGK